MNGMNAYNVDPELIISKKDFDGAMQTINQLEKELRYRLDPRGELILDRLIDLQERILLMVAQENRIQGFQMGMKMNGINVTQNADIDGGN